MFKVFRKTIALLAIAFFCFVWIPAFAASSTDEAVLGNDRWSVQSDGDFLPNSDNSYDIGGSSNQVADIYYNGVLNPGTSSSSKYLIESIATGDTLLSTESGKTFIVTAATSDTITFTLPSAVTSGLQFTFVDGKASSTYTFNVDPYSTNKIMYSISSVPLHAGDKITSTGQTGDNVTLISDASGNWYIKSMYGPFTDGGA